MLKEKNAICLYCDSSDQRVWVGNVFTHEGAAKRDGSYWICGGFANAAARERSAAAGAGRGLGRWTISMVWSRPALELSSTSDSISNLRLSYYSSSEFKGRRSLFFFGPVINYLPKLKIENPTFQTRYQYHWQINHKAKHLDRSFFKQWPAVEVYWHALIIVCAAEISDSETSNVIKVIYNVYSAAIKIQTLMRSIPPGCSAPPRMREIRPAPARATLCLIKWS